MKEYLNLFDMISLGSADSTDASDSHRRESAVSNEEPVDTEVAEIIDRLEAGEEISKTDVALETGLCPEEFIPLLLEHFDGQLRQCELVEITGWSKSSISRLLNQMEEKGTVNRVQIGRTKQVYLPGEKDAKTAVETPEDYHSARTSSL